MSSGLAGAAEQAQEDGLEHVFGVGGVAGDAVRRAKDQAVVSPEDSLELVWDGDSGFLDNQYVMQGTPPGVRLHP
jgi:hypothetical protein